MNRSLLRILDANLNRAREALRVLEDFSRFALDDEQLCSALKHLRHELAAATAAIAGDAILHRDAAGDVGTAIKTPSEQSREDLSHIVIAAGKRLGEALRSIEEVLKTIDTAAATRVETIRYRFYDLEKQLAISIGDNGRARMSRVKLCVLISESCCRRPWLDVVDQALGGGADCLQLREKSLESGELLRRANLLVKRCRAAGAISIINDRPDIALLSGADGVHVGQDDLPAIEVRKMLGREKIVGVSTHEIEHARRAFRDGADYLGIGPVFRSATKPREILPGLDYARQVSAELGEKIPVMAIAGITAANVGEVLATGLRAIAVTRAVTDVENVEAATRELKAALSRGAGISPAKHS